MDSVLGGKVSVFILELGRERRYCRFLSVSISTTYIIIETLHVINVRKFQLFKEKLNGFIRQTCWSRAPLLFQGHCWPLSLQDPLVKLAPESFHSAFRMALTQPPSYSHLRVSSQLPGAELPQQLPNCSPHLLSPLSCSLHVAHRQSCLQY